MKYRLEQHRIEMLSILVAFEKSNGTAEDVARLMDISKRALFFRLKRLRLSMRKLHELKRGKRMSLLKETLSAQCDANNCGDEYPVEVTYDIDTDVDPQTRSEIVIVEIHEHDPLRCPTCGQLMSDDSEWLKDAQTQLAEKHAGPSKEDEDDARADALYDEMRGK